MGPGFRFVMICASVGACLAVPARAAAPPSPPSDLTACRDAIGGAEKAAGLPPGLLPAIGLVESGRLDAKTGRVAPWPWTINVAGTGYFFDTKAAAMDAVDQARASGVQSIDVGCMQINLLQHPDAFATLDQAFDPRANATYAASFLSRLFARTGDWAAAAAFYHSQTPAIAGPYRDRVLAEWHGAPPVAALPTDVVAARTDANRLPGLRSMLADVVAGRSALVSAGVIPLPSRPVAARVAGLSARRLDERFD